MHPGPDRIPRIAAAAEKARAGKGPKRPNNPRRPRKSMVAQNLRRMADGRPHGKERPPEAPRRDTSGQSIPLLDFFTPLASMWFCPVFPACFSLYPRVVCAR